MRRLLALLLVLLALGLLLLLRPTGSGPGPAPETAGTEAQALLAPTAAEVAGPDHPDAGEEGRREATTAPAQEDGNRRPFTVRVLLPGDGGPAAGARVWWIPVLDPAEDWARIRAHGSGLDRDFRTLFAELGREVRTDTRGEARLELPPGTLVLVLGASAPGLFRQETVSGLEDRTEVVVRLRPESFLHMRVLDAGGRPVPDVHVAAVPADRLLDSVGVALAGIFPLASTDGQGRVVFRDIRQRLGNLPGGVVAVGVPGPFPESVTARLDVENLPRDEVTLPLPPTGAVVVEVLDAAGRPAPDDTRVRLLRAGTAGDPAARLWSVLGERRTRGGRVRFPAVGLGLDLEVAAILPDHPREVPGHGPGPERPGEEVLLTVRPDTEALWLTGRALTAGGAPLAGERLFLDWSPFLGGLPWSVPADAGGRFRIPLPDVPEAGLRLRLRRPAPDDPLASPPLTVPASLHPGDNEVGDVFLAPLPLVQGRVLDPDHAAAGGATVLLEAALRQPPGPILEDMAWRPVADPAPVTSGPDGRFVLPRSAAPVLTGDGSWRLTARAPGHIPAHVTLRWPRQDLTLRLPRNRVVGRMLLDLALEGPSDLQARFLPPAAGDQEKRRRVQPAYDQTARWDGDTFWWEDLPWPRGRVEVRAGRTGELVAVVDDVEVRDGEETRDPRLDPLDLRGRLRRLAIRFVDEQGDPVWDVTVQPVDWSNLVVIGSSPRGVWRPLLAGDALPDFVARAAGRLAVRLHGVDRDRDVVLERAPLLEFRLEPVPELPPGFQVEVHLQQPDLPHVSGGGRFDRQGRLALRAPARGRLRVEPRLHQDLGEEGSRSLGAQGLLEPLEIVVPPSGDRISFSLRLDLAVLDRVLQRMQEESRG